MSLKFELNNNTYGQVARLTVALVHAHRSRLERRVARLLTAECARRGLAVHGDIKIEAQENWITGALDMTAAAFVEAIDGVTTRPAKRLVANSARAVSTQPRRKPSCQAIG